MERGKGIDLEKTVRGELQNKLQNPARLYDDSILFRHATIPRSAVEKESARVRTQENAILSEVKGC